MDTCPLPSAGLRGAAPRALLSEHLLLHPLPPAAPPLCPVQHPTPSCASERHCVSCQWDPGPA